MRHEIDPRPVTSRRGAKRTAWIAAGAWLAAACTPPAPLATVEDVDLDRFMGRWYVIANIPTFIERGAHNAVETYERDEDGTIATTFSFRRDGFDGEPVEYRPRGYPSEQSNGLWGMQFVWPFKAEYRIAHLSADYTETIIARTARDYVWIMARTPTIAPSDYERLVARVAALGYDTSKLERVPQQW